MLCFLHKNFCVLFFIDYLYYDLMQIICGDKINAWHF